MRKKGIAFSPQYGQNDSEALMQIKKAGFDSIMLGWYAEDRVREISDTCRQIGLAPEILHAPFSHINDMWREGSDGDYILNVLSENVENAGKSGIPYMVVHLSSGDNAPYINDLGISRFDRLINIAIKNNVTVAFENQRKLANIAYMMERYSDCDNVGFCWDNGHEACFANGREYMPLFGHKLVCTHIHDNFAQKDEDLHLIPFDGCYDFHRYAELIKKYDYKGTLLLETTINSGSYSKNFTPAEFLERAYKAVTELADMCDG